MIGKVSKYRSAIMGVAILWVVLHHSGLNLSRLFAIKRSGYGGVDIFLFVSGLGLSVSLSKNEDILAFYKKRILRIFPNYIPMLLVFLFLNSSVVSIMDWVLGITGNLTGFSFWANTGGGYAVFNWYMPAIITYYFLTPIFYSVLKRQKEKGLIALLALALIADLCFTSTETHIAIARLPIFLLGLWAGTIGDKEFPKRTVKNYCMVYGIGLIGAVLLLCLYKYQETVPAYLYNVFYPYILMTPAIICACCQIFDVLSKSKIGERIVQCFSFLGKLSLDIYLIHIVLMWKIGTMIGGPYDNTIPAPASISNIIIWVLIMLCIIAISYLYSTAIDKVRGLLLNPAQDNRAQRK